jgi:2-polyprenyl-3-methyl-5-hydroxy-6-metoxy-1,4-benzoquinol methylase
MRMRSVVRRVKRLARRQDWEDYSAEEWNAQHGSATWKYLGGLEQVPRYAVIEGWRQRLRPSGRVLDLGCGEGVLLQQIPATASVDYTGIDLSQVAITEATKRIRDASLERFVCGDIEKFAAVNRSPFDVIVFNEVLYYVADPSATVTRYRNILAAEGIVIVSVFHRKARTWKRVDESLANQRLQTTFVRDVSSGKAWHLGVYENR